MRLLHRIKGASQFTPVTQLSGLFLPTFLVESLASNIKLSAKDIIMVSMEIC